jgi:hypothetical protein
VSHAMGAKCLCCGVVIQPDVCPEGCPDGHGYAYTVCSPCEKAPDQHAETAPEEGS